ncbi:Tryptophan halogenase [Catenovulum agarivorans DS-2]|uniref:Tryptophan halogenase n=1 Tax=Catenovulum agarivorans DS-2 TaxID=1328313 RepID=W7QF20_9ALTE|nr:tryptophan halogenase family protein [Catenovulum agarivorans]EWH11494.1 Tryptophan halogenase [Catenovulum agarivorans DS-2]
MNKVTKVVIAGGGTAGWMAAAALTKLISNLEVTLIESEEIGTVGVGEATIPTLVFYHRLLKINEAEFMKAVNATFKLGISFENWRDVNEDYIHAFGVTGRDCWAAGFQHFWKKGREKGFASDFGDYCIEQVAAKRNRFAQLPKNGINYAYHMDASLYAKFLRGIAEQHGIKRIEGKIGKVNVCSENGFIQSLEMENGQVIEGDLFLDCTGQRGLLIEQTLHAGFEDWSHWLPCDSAIAIQTTAVEKPRAYTRSIAHPFGWQWRIPLQNRVGNGIVYSSKYVSDEEAKQTLLNNIEGEALTEPRVIKFRTGTRRKHWHKNCVAVGLSSGFLEPLESTSIHLIQQAIVRLLRIFPYDGVKQCDIDEFNQQTKVDVEAIRDFIIMHYKVTNRDDADFWHYCRNMQVPETLAHRLELFEQTGKVFRKNNELFDDSWQQVMIGQGLIPQHYHPIVDNMPDEELKRFLKSIKDGIDNTVNQLPEHWQFIQQFCPSPLAN